MASKFARFESSWLQLVGNIAREDVKNMHNWSGRTETATENRVDQAGSRCHCGSHPSVASLIAADQWCMFCTPSCNTFHTLLSTGFKSGKFHDHSWGWINSGVSVSNDAIVEHAQWSFQVSQGSVETLLQVRWKMFTSRCNSRPKSNYIYCTIVSMVQVYAADDKLYNVRFNAWSWSEAGN